MFDRSSLHTDEFSWEKSLALAMASQLAYHRSIEGVRHVVTQTWGFERCEPFNLANTQGFVAWDAQSVVVCFRGTESLGDWLANLKLLKTGRAYGRIHLGFSGSFEVVRPLLNGVLQEASPNGKRVWLTGHSLGGALAMIAGAELADSLATSGFYTYGQPKTGDAQTKLFFEQRFRKKFHRFVNDDDIVPQVPPTFSHVGLLTWFDRRGNLNRFQDSAEMASESAENRGGTHHEMDPVEFEVFQRELQVLEAATAGDPVELDLSIEGIFPSVSDHGISRYINCIRRYVSRRPNVDDLLEQAVSARADEVAGVESDTPRSRSALRSATSVPVLLNVKNASWEPPAGLQIQSRLGSIVTARSTLEQIEKLQEDRDIISIEVSREGGVPELAISVPFVEGTAVQEPPIDERGDSAIVAIIDTGVDVLHEAFQDDNGHTRILALWDQRAPSQGASPKDVDPATYTQSLGRLYLAAELQQMIHQGSTPMALRDPNRHGTHVASIAAGRMAPPFAGGLAPEAKLLVIIPDMETSPGDPPSIGYSNSHVDALAFIRATAEKLGLPVAVNVSLGMNAGAHDGSSTLEAGFDAFSGIGRDPGFVVIKSAGNERGFKGHAAAHALEGGISEIVWNSDMSLRDMDYIEAWFSGFDEMTFTLIDPAGNRSGVVSAANPVVSGQLGGNFCQLSFTRLHRDNGDNRLTITIMPDVQMIQGGKWVLEITGVRLPGGGEIHAWVERDRSRAISFDSGDNDEMTLSIPGTADTVITVGACEAGQPLRLTDSSSWGLTRDGRPKPDLCAPGKDITAAKANTGDHKEVVSMTGTSMAAPHVTGAVALLLSRLHKDPNKQQVNARQTQQALVLSAKQFTGRHNKGFGFGALDVSAFIDKF